MAAAQRRFRPIPRIRRQRRKARPVFERQRSDQTGESPRHIDGRRPRRRLYDGAGLPGTYQPVHVVVRRRRKTAGRQPGRDPGAARADGDHQKAHGSRSESTPVVQRQIFQPQQLRRLRDLGEHLPASLRRRRHPRSGRNRTATVDRGNARTADRIRPRSGRPEKRVCGPCGGRPPEKLLPGGLDQPERRADDRFPSSVDGQPDAEREDRQRAGHRQSVRLRAEPDEKNVRGLRSGHRSGDFRRHAETIHGQRTAADVGRLSATGLYPLRRQCRSDRRLRVP